MGLRMVSRSSGIGGIFPGLINTLRLPLRGQGRPSPLPRRHGRCSQIAADLLRCASRRPRAMNRHGIMFISLVTSRASPL